MIQSRASRTARRRILAYTLLIALCLVLLGASSAAPFVEFRRGVGFALAPVQATLANATRSVTSVFGAITQIDALRRTNEELASRVQVLEAANQRLLSIEAENERLTELLGIQSAFAGDTVAAQVISRQFSQAERVVAIDRGTDQGISVGDPVLGSGGALVGSIMQTGSNFSQVILLNDPRSVVIGLVESSRATGEVEGRLSAPLGMTKIPATDAVAVGDRVVTAGLQLSDQIRSPYPRALLIGRVVDIEDDPSDVVQVALVEPATDLERLEYALVITDFEPVVVPPAGPSPAPSGSPRAGGSPGASESAVPTPSAEPTRRRRGTPSP